MPDTDHSDHYHSRLAGDRPPEPLARWSRKLFWPVAVLQQALLLLVYYWPSRKLPLGDERLYLRAVDSILETGSSGLEALWPPLYAWFLTPFISIAGGELWLVQAAQIGLWIAAARGVGALTSAGTGRETAGSLAALGMVAYTPLAAYCHYLWPEILHLALLVAIAWLSVRLFQSKWPGTAAAVGLLLALALQTKALLIAFLPLIFLGLWLALPRSRRLPTLATVALAFLIGFFPTVTVAARDGAPVMSRSGWFNLRLGLNDSARREFMDRNAALEYQRYLDSAASAGARNRVLREKVIQQLATDGLVATARRQLGKQYFRLFDKDSSLTAQLPGGAAARPGAGYPQTPPALVAAVRAISYSSWAALLALSAIGLVLFPYRDRVAGRWVLTFLAIQLAMFLWLHVKTRYRVQMLPALVFFAAFALDRWLGRKLPGSEPGSTPLRRGLAALVAGGALWLAFSPESA